MTSERNADITVNVKCDLLYILTPSPTPGKDLGAILAKNWGIRSR